MRHELLIDGGRFCNYDGFVGEFNRAYLSVIGDPTSIADGYNAFDDFDEELEDTGDRLSIRWLNSQKSIIELGHAAMKEFWMRELAESRIKLPHAEFWHQSLQERIDEAAAGQGRTLFEWIVFQLRSTEIVDLSLE